MNTRIICQKCKFYFVTWQPNQPHGCKAYGFKSKQVPSIVVKQSSGIECGFYQQKSFSSSEEETD
jgi:hypothetical protein